MKWVIIILVLLPAVLQAQQYKVKDRCMGNGTYAMVVEFNDLYYVVETPEYFQPGWVIEDLVGIATGGYRTLYYFDSVGISNSVEVRVLSRWQWRYAGYPGARAVCRQITQASFW